MDVVLDLRKGGDGLQKPPRQPQLGALDHSVSWTDANSEMCDR